MLKRSVSSSVTSRRILLGAVKAVDPRAVRWRRIDRRRASNRRGSLRDDAVAATWGANLNQPPPIPGLLLLHRVGAIVRTGAARHFVSPYAARKHRARARLFRSDCFKKKKKKPVVPEEKDRKKRIQRERIHKKQGISSISVKTFNTNVLQQSYRAISKRRSRGEFSAENLTRKCGRLKKKKKTSIRRLRKRS